MGAKIYRCYQTPALACRGTELSEFWTLLSTTADAAGKE